MIHGATSLKFNTGVCREGLRKTTANLRKSVSRLRFELGTSETQNRGFIA